jgi:uncharacterized phiE125 gp8 family phage protein
VPRYPQGQPFTIPITVRQRNADGTYSLVDAGTVTTTVKIANADGTSSVTGTYSAPAHDSTGTYHQDVPAADISAIGHYQYAVVTTGSGAGVQPGDFDVYDPFEPALLPLQDAKDHLNITNTTSDAEIASWIATIETSMEAMTGGPLVNRPVTERAELTCDLMLLQVRQRPLVSVTSVVSVPNGAAADLSAGLDIDPLANAVRMKGGWAFPVFSPVVTVTYVAGWGPAVPAAFGNAARLILAHLWDTQHGPAARPSMGGDEMVSLPEFGFMIPSRAAELLEGSLNGLPFVCEVFA